MHGRSTLLIASVLAIPSDLHAGDCELEQIRQLFPSGEADGFGFSLDVSGDVAIVGDNLDDGAASNSGAAFILRFDGSSWSQEQKLVASDGSSADYFGQAVAIAADVAVIGAPRDDDGGSGSGAAYVFRFNGQSWVEEQKLVASDAAAWDAFGVSVATSGKLILVGGYGDDLGYNSGAVWVFQFDGSEWVEGEKLLASDGVANQYFGARVDMSGGRAVVGAYGDYSLGTPTGAAYIFRSVDDGWEQEQKLIAADAGALDEFGRAVAIKGNLVLIGARNADSPNDNLPDGPGAAYVFRFDGSHFAEQSKLTASDGADSGRFGVAVAIDGEIAIVGDDRAGPGSAYVFRDGGSGTWTESSKIVGSDKAASDHFGVAIALSGRMVMVGAPDDDDDGDPGSVYHYDLQCVCPADVDGSGAIDSGDLIAVLLAWGACEACPEDINGDDGVDIDDLMEVVVHWGACP